MVCSIDGTGSNYRPVADGFTHFTLRSFETLHHPTDLSSGLSPSAPVFLAEVVHNRSLSIPVVRSDFEPVDRLGWHRFTLLFVREPTAECRFVAHGRSPGWRVLLVAVSTRSAIAALASATASGWTWISFLFFCLGFTMLLILSTDDLLL